MGMLGMIMGVGEVVGENRGGWMQMMMRMIERVMKER